MKCTIILIATVFLIGISVPDVSAKTGGGKSDTGAAKKEPEAAKKEPEGKKEAAPKGETKETPPVDKDDTANDDDDQPATSDDDDDQPETSDDDDDENANPEEEEAPAEEEPEPEPAPKKGKPAQKPTSQKPKRGPPKKKTAQDDEDDVTEKPRGKGKKSPSLSDLKNQAASMNPANVIAALLKTPNKQLKKALPQLNQLAKSLKGTPLGPIFENLTSLFGNSSPQIWTQVFQAFPKFVAVILNTVGQFTAVGVKAVGRVGKSVVEVADVLFNTGKDILGQVTMLPGGNLLTPFGQVLDLAHGTIVTPIDDIVEEVTATAKRSEKKLKRAAERNRSGAGAGLLGGDGGLLGFAGL